MYVDIRMWRVLQSTVSLVNSQPVMLLMVDLREPMAHGTCSYQISGIPVNPGMCTMLSMYTVHNKYVYSAAWTSSAVGAGA